MLFKGRLRLPSDPGEGIPIDLELEDVYLSLDSAGEDFGEWRLDTVEIERLFSNQFSLLLDGEEMVFIADDALGFAYDGLAALEDVKSRLSKRRFFKGRKPKRRDAASTEPVDDAGTEEAQPPETPAAAPLPEPPIPEAVPFFPQSTPSFSDSVADSTSGVDDSTLPVQARAIEPAADDDSPQAPPPVAPEPVPHAPVAAQPPVAEPSAPTSPEVEPYDDDDEFVVEDVAAYSYVPNVASSAPDEKTVSEPETLDESDDSGEFEIEDAAVATGAVQREAHQTPEPEAVQRTPEVHPLGDPRGEPETVESESHVETTEPASESTPAPERPAAPAPEEPEPTEFTGWSSNGHADGEPAVEPAKDGAIVEPTAADNGSAAGSAAPQTQKTGKHQRSSGKSRSFFGRKKSQEPEEHEHLYESSKTVGGITRSVCSICDHVSFAGEDVYQDW